MPPMDTINLFNADVALMKELFQAANNQRNNLNTLALTDKKVSGPFIHCIS